MRVSEYHRESLGHGLGNGRAANNGCTDQKQNGDESGVDCGGSCAIACKAELDDISVLWSRAFQVVPGRYNAVAYLENQNENVAVQKINYRFRFADKDNVYIGKREGSTYVPPASRFAVFEPAIGIGNSIPVFTSFEFTEEPVWMQVSEEKVTQIKVLVSEISLETPDTLPHLSAKLKNNSLFVIPSLDVVAILYDASGNAVSASQTYIDRFFGEEERIINFTWPEPLPGEVIATEIIPLFDIFLARLP